VVIVECAQDARKKWVQLMAGDWIVRCKGLNRKAEVLAIARATGMSRRIVADLLCDFWEWADGETETGKLPGVTLEQLPDAVADTSLAFWEAVVSVGWLTAEPDGLSVPNFTYWMGRGAKKRLKDSRRQQIHRTEPSRSKRDKSVTAPSRSKRDKNVTIVQYSREEKKSNTPLPPKGGVVVADLPLPVAPESLNTAAFREAWSRWAAFRSEIKKPLKPTTVAAQLKHLAAMGSEGAVAAIEQSIRNGWTGLFAPRADPRKPADLFAGQKAFMEGGPL
jgi:hypothetical protein